MYRCQSALKLVELENKYGIFRRSQCRTALDLAAAPGGFTQVALEFMKKYDSTQTSKQRLEPMAIAVDLRHIEPMAGMHAIRANILHHRDIIRGLEQRLGTARPLDVVLHDGVSVVKGQHAFSVTYSQNQMALSSMLLACDVLHRFAPPGEEKRQQCFVTKVLRSTHLPRVLEATRTYFHTVDVHKPAACKEESLETYIVARGFKSTRWQKDRKHKNLGVFSIAPSRTDTDPGRQSVWRCLGCGQMRVGLGTCPRCQNQPAQF